MAPIPFIVSARSVYDVVDPDLLSASSYTDGGMLFEREASSLPKYPTSGRNPTIFAATHFHFHMCVSQHACLDFGLIILRKINIIQCFFSHHRLPDARTDIEGKHYIHVPFA